MQPIITLINSKILQYPHNHHFGKVLKQNYLAQIKNGHFINVHFFKS
jgi:hypothetical protein